MLITCTKNFTGEIAFHSPFRISWRQFKSNTFLECVPGRWKRFHVYKLSKVMSPITMYIYIYSYRAISSLELGSKITPKTFAHFLNGGICNISPSATILTMCKSYDPVYHQPMWVSLGVHFTFWETIQRIRLLEVVVHLCDPSEFIERHEEEKFLKVTYGGRAARYIFTQLLRIPTCFGANVTHVGIPPEWFTVIRKNPWLRIYITMPC